ncbi:hypothetical protein B9Z55_009083 [Caenorhabditis nigoni]|uniref:DUF38 domain-containing protein n=1 Tax=Caenorhabditis nigoni TaxID=1611254 RepID=A0A2G5UQL2_9PELO|nr:hypothetical protein B9Z55_009083 [Caenorhabditis nigoni]
MSRPLIFDLWPTVMDRMDLANRILLSQKCPALRRTDQRCPDVAATVEITPDYVRINDTTFYVEKYESGEHIEVSMDTFCGHHFKTVVLKTTVPLPEAREKLFETIMKRRSGVLKVKNMSVLRDLNLPPNLKLCVQNLKVARPYSNSREDDMIKQTRTLTLFKDLQKVLTADSFPLESLEMDYNFSSLRIEAPAKTVVLTGQAYGIETSNIHRIHVKYCNMDPVRVMDLVERWQMVQPEVGRHYSLETGHRDEAIGYFTAAQISPGAEENFKFANDLFTYGFTFSINQEKVLNVFMETGKDDDGMNKYVMHFKVDPI